MRRSIPHEAFVESVTRERELRGLDAGRSPVETVYLGGGTPSLLHPSGLARLIEESGPAADAEITIEANPDDVTELQVRSWVQAGINRLSLGVQSFDDSVLEWMHRTHSAADAERAVLTARSGGLENVSLDLIFGLPERLDHRWEEDLERAVALAPDHLSIYGLTVESHTALWRWMGRGAAKAVSEERFEVEFMTAHSMLSDEGFTHYEVSNYAKRGRQSRHNRAYWSGAAYVGLGPSAHSYTRPVRRWNVHAWAKYHETVRAGRDPLGGTEELTEEQTQLEAVMLGLRTTTGVRLPTDRSHPSWLIAAIDRGWATIDDGILTLTPSGWLRMDDLAHRLTTFLEGA